MTSFDRGDGAEDYGDSVASRLSLMTSRDIELDTLKDGLLLDGESSETTSPAMDGDSRALTTSTTMTPQASSSSSSSSSSSAANRFVWIDIMRGLYVLWMIASDVVPESISNKNALLW